MRLALAVGRPAFSNEGNYLIAAESSYYQREKCLAACQDERRLSVDGGLSGDAIMSRAPQKPTDSEEPQTYFSMERRRRRLDDDEAGDTIPQLPSSSPWAVGIDQVSGPEPSINREEDGPIITENHHG
jgi:hypothetical protein